MSQTPHGAPIRTDDVARRLDELRPLASTSRLATLALGTLVLLMHGASAPWVYAVLVLFLLWASFSLWRDITGRSGVQQSFLFWFVILAILVAVRGTEQGVLLIPVIVHPLTMVTLLRGFRQGMSVAVVGALGLLVSFNPIGFDLAYGLAALGMLCLPPAMALVARPMAALRQRVHLAAELERELDPRRGLQATGLAIADRLRSVTAAQRVILCHRDAELPTVLVADQDDSAYEASPALAGRLLSVLAELPVQAMSLDVRSAPGSGLLSDMANATRHAAVPHVRQIAALLEAQTLQLVPDAPGDPRAGWLLVAYGSSTPRQLSPWPMPALAAFVAEMRRLVQQASYLDSLQAEIAAHERARIGRDLHDSAVQPYLGLKFAIDVLGQRCTPDNPLRAQVQDLQRFCETELNELRDTVAVLRSGEVRGDNALVPAVRRQAKRFANLFGIQTTLDVSDDLVTSRALSGAVLHMVNEALNNVRRHTKAKQVWMSLSVQDKLLKLVIRDDAGQRSGFPAPSFQPRSLTERTRELGGSLELRRHQGLDTEIHITIPI